MEVNMAGTNNTRNIASMNKRSFSSLIVVIAIGLLALLAVSCSVHENEMEPESSPGHDSGQVFYAMMESPSDADTKVYADTKLRVLWDENDHVSIFNKNTANQEYCFLGATGDNAGTFKAVGNAGTGSALDLVYSVYPYQEDTDINNNGVISVSLPSIQTYRKDSFGLGANTMVSCTTGDHLLYKNLCGYLTLNLYGDSVTVSSISLKGNNGEHLAGRASVHASLDDVPTMTFSSNATEEITLTFDSPVTLGTTKETATTFSLVIPPTVFSKGFTLTVKSVLNGVFEKTTSNRIEINRNTQVRMSAVKVELEYLPNQVLRYTSTDGKVVQPNVSGAFGANILSNEYINGQGMIIFDGDITSNGDAAFQNSHNLATVIIPESVMRIGESAFSGCTRLESITLLSMTPPAGANAMFDNTNNCPIYVPLGCLNAYREADYWSKYASRIMEQGTSVLQYMNRKMGNKPVDICVIPEGFTLEELDKFRSLASEGIDFLFDTEPFKTYKDYFNVYFLSIPSQDSGASVTDGNGSITTKKNTAFNVRWGQNSFSDMEADVNLVFSFVSNYCPEIVNGSLAIKDVPILIIINDTRYGGRSHAVSDGRGYAMVPYAYGGGTTSWDIGSAGYVATQDEPVPEGEDYNNYARRFTSGELSAIGKTTGNWHNILLHEFGGHCFARFSDEYWRTSYLVSQGKISTHSWKVPFGLNVSGYYDNVPWSDLLDIRENLVAKDSNYSRIGRFQGADNSLFNKWRSETISCMIDNRAYFSTWQRILIVKKIMEKAGMDFSLDGFFEKDCTLDPARDNHSNFIMDRNPESSIPCLPLLPQPILSNADEY